MKKLSEPLKTEFDLIQNEFIINQKQVKSQISIYIKQRNYAIFFAILCLIISVGIVFQALMIAGEKKKVDKIVFKEDGSGGITYIGVVDNRLKVNTRVYVANQLIEYVKALNSVPQSRDMRQYNVKKVQFMTDTKYYPQLQTYIKDLYIKNQNNEVVAQITAIGEVTKGIWAVDWSQYINNVSIGDYKTMLTFKMIENSATDTAIMQYNPLDIAVTDVETTKRIAQ